MPVEHFSTLVTSLLFSLTASTSLLCTVSNGSADGSLLELAEPLSVEVSAIKKKFNEKSSITLRI